MGGNPSQMHVSGCTLTGTPNRRLDAVRCNSTIWHASVYMQEGQLFQQLNSIVYPEHT